MTRFLISASESGSSLLERSRMLCDPMFEVKMMMVFLKLTVRPCPSVIRPSSNTWRRTLKTSGCAFSISSKSTTEYGRRRTASDSCPPSSYPTYPGGAPSRREIDCFSMYSDMSMRTICDSSLKSCSQSVFASCVLPTPVGPRNMKLAIGRSGFERPALDRWIASAMAWTACGCPTTLLDMLSSRLRRRSVSVDCNFETGI
mmetsp:Transcript_4747/g.11422  ORF Transcript_4747/g.11422 Transcript_4747/m.11422 type:complete len:201 (+) Transcript_4747:666-1268(+)